MNQSGEGQARRGLGLMDQVRPTRSRTIHIAHTKRKSARNEENNEDGVGQVEDEDDGVMALGRDRTHVYIVDDEDGVDQVKKEGEGIEPYRRLKTHRHR